MNQRIKTAVAAALLAGASLPAHAFETIEFGSDVRLETRLNFTYTLSDRLESSAEKTARNAGINDGDNDFDRYALTSNRLSMLFDGKLAKGDNLGIVFSGSYFYDDVYQKSNDNDPGTGLPNKTFNPNAVNKQPAFDEFTNGAERYHGGYARLLDTYAFGVFDFAGNRLSARVGRQAVNWGEALFFPSMALAQGPADGSKTGIPGTEVKDQLLPEDQVSLSFEADRLTLLAHWQFDFQETLAPAPGSYLNSSDAVGPGGKCLGPWAKLPAVPVAFPSGFEGCSFGIRGEDITPSDTSQWGAGTRYRVTDATELGLYYLNYNERTPVPLINAFTPGTKVPAFFGIPGNQIGNGSYQIRYFDDVTLIGGTASTSLGIVSVAAEVTYKDGAPVLVNTVVDPATRRTIPNPTRGQVMQYVVNAFTNFGRTEIAPQTILIAEVSAVDVTGVDARKAPGVEDLPGPVQAFFPATTDKTFGDGTGVAVSATASLGYPNFVEGWDLNVALGYLQQVHGRSLTGGVGGEGDKRGSLGVTFTRLSNLSMGLTYLGFYGGARNNIVEFRPLTDRDQLSFTAKYSF